MSKPTATSYFTGRGDAPRQYPWLSGDERCEAAVAGGGLTGCFAAYELARAGVDVTLLSQTPIGYSSAAVENSVFGWSNELLLTNLARSVGRDEAVRVCRLLDAALDELERFAQGAEPFDFVRRDAFFYVTRPHQADDLHTEYLIRRHNGFEVEFLDRQEAGERFSFELQAGILCRDGGAEADGYLLCHALAEAARRHGARIYENTAVVSAESVNGGVLIQTALDRSVRAKRLILATGWRQTEGLSLPLSRRTGFTVVTEPVSSFAGYESRALVKNATANIGLRSTADGRLLLHGLDCPLPAPDGRMARLFPAQRLFRRTCAELFAAGEEMLCAIPGLAAAYCSRAAHPVTRDGLPLAGPHPEYEHVQLDLTSGPNSGLFALLTAQSLARVFLGKEPEPLFEIRR